MNFKSKVIEWGQKHDKDVRFEMLEEQEHKGKKIYRMGLKIDGEVIASDQNFSKKKAEQKAAEKACELLRIAVD